jgi:hypothetical protein
MLIRIKRIFQVCAFAYISKHNYCARFKYTMFASVQICGLDGLILVAH